MVAVISMCVAALLTDTTRTDPLTLTLGSDHLNHWFKSACHPVSQSTHHGNSRMVTDLVELIMLSRLSRAAEMGSKIVSLFGIRILSTFMLITATSIAWLGQL